MNIDPLLLSGWLVFWTLRSALVLGLGLATLGLLRRSSARLAHYWIFTILLTVGALPILDLATRSIGLPAEIPRAEITLPPMSAASTDRDAHDSVFLTAPSALESELRSDQSIWSYLGRGLLLAWVLGFAANLLRSLGSQLWLDQLRTSARPVRSPLVIEQVEQLRHELQIRTRPRLVESDSIRSPMTWGIRQAWIALPGNSDWREEQWNSVLLHELLHVKRRDSLVEWICQILCALQWWNPLVWMAVGQLRKEREYACDQAVLDAGANPMIYARTLLGASSTNRNPLPASMARRDQLETRLRRILQPQSHFTSLPWQSRCTGLAILMLALFPSSWILSAKDAGYAEVDGLRLPTTLAEGFSWPVGLRDTEMDGYYSARVFAPDSSPHLGTDFNGNKGGNTDVGDPVYSIANGLVVISEDFRAGWGNVIVVRHRYRDSDGVIRFVDSLYAHLLDRHVEKGDLVLQDQMIGKLGNNNGMYSGHLHFEIRHNLRIGVTNRSEFMVKEKLNSYWADPMHFIRSQRKAD